MGNNTPVVGDDTSPYTQPTTEQIAAELAACAADKVSLQNEFSQVIHRVMLEGLKAIESALPNHKVAGHSDNRLHFALRRQLLSHGNDQKRALPELLKAYRVRQVMERTVVARIGANIPPEQTIIREGDLQQ
jgi:hypothetical protein